MASELNVIDTCQDDSESAAREEMVETTQALVNADVGGSAESKLVSSLVVEPNTDEMAEILLQAKLAQRAYVAEQLKLHYQRQVEIIKSVMKFDLD